MARTTIAGHSPEMTGSAADSTTRSGPRPRPAARRIALLAYGTRGDIQPVLVVGDELRRRGHSVAMTVNVNSVEWAERSGLEIVPMPPDAEAFLKSSEGRHMLSDGRLVAFSRELSKIETAANDEMTRACVKCCRGADLVVSTVMSVLRGTAIVERSGAAHGLLLTMPMAPTSEYAQIHGPFRRAPFGFVNRLSHRLMLDLWWKNFATAQARLRDTLALPPNSERPRVELGRSVGVYSEVLAPRPRDWRPDQVVTGFTVLTPELRARLGEDRVPDDLEAFLAAGDPPIFFGFGSLPVLDPEKLLADVARVTADRGLRGLVGAGWTDYGDPRGLPSHLHVTGAFNHDAVLPRCRAAVHHGGAGTTAAALRANLPTVVVSVFADQPFWGWRVEQTRTGATFPFQKFDARTLGRALDRALRPEAAQRAREFGAQLRAENGAEAAADVIEGWLPEARSGHERSAGALSA